MKVIVLCGGNGTRMRSYSFPKPLNMIHGKPSIAYCLQHLPAHVDEIHFIVAPHLYEYHIEEVIRNLFKTRSCIFHPLPYFTRGPVESGWLGTLNLVCNETEPIMFLDNDVLYQFPENLFDHSGSAFLGYAYDSTGSSAYSYITLNDTEIIDIVEKKRISNQFCCGVYGFASLSQFRDYASRIIQTQTKEMYMSMIYTELLRDHVRIHGFDFGSQILHIGSINELQQSWDYLSKPSMRICFDLDNTLVTYPVVPGDYTTVKPIPQMIDLVRKMKSEGHTVIIHTARRMATHSHNVGATIRDIGRITLDTLDQFHIPYDEILFGKPIADMYIDDRAINPYRHDIQSMGYLYSPVERPVNALPTNKYNHIRVEEGVVIKTGPSYMIDGECYYYQHIPTSLIHYFPKFYKTLEKGRNTELYLEYIQHIPFATLYQSELLQESHIDRLFETILALHHTPSDCRCPSQQEIYDHYITKLQRRFDSKDDYPYENAETYQTECMRRLITYASKPFQIVPYIHGDLWFSNILLTYQHDIKLIDMRGKIHNQLITGGDAIYDYAKLYQSILGYDCILYGTSVSPEYSTQMRRHVEQLFIKHGLSVSDIRDVSLALMMGTFHAITSADIKLRLWNWLTHLYDETESE